MNGYPGWTSTCCAPQHGAIIRGRCPRFHRLVPQPASRADDGLKTGASPVDVYKLIYGTRRDISSVTSRFSPSLVMRCFPVVHTPHPPPRSPTDNRLGPPALASAGKRLGLGNGSVDRNIPIGRVQTPYPLRVLQQFVAFALFAQRQHRRQHQRQRTHGRCRTTPSARGRAYVAQSCGTPQPISPFSARLAVHDIAAHLDILRFRPAPSAPPRSASAISLRQAILHRRVDRIGQVLLNHVHKRIHHAVAHLLRRQAERHLRVENRKQRLYLCR